MLVRYTTKENGKVQRQAEIYTRDEHPIRNGRIDADALKIADRLKSNGFSAYIVGGAVRDLLLNRKPKDFDLVTNASPEKIRRIFRNSRIIGKRFKLVHVYFGNKNIEVTTFRAANTEFYANLYGSMAEDALRRDFSVNALYYSPSEGRLIDYVKGYQDLKARRLKEIIPLNRIFTEDPVRILRGIKYAVSCDLKMNFFLRRAMKRAVDLFADVSSSRLTEELFKLLLSGYSVEIIKRCVDYGILRYILPALAELLDSPKETEYRDYLYRSLSFLDTAVRENDEERRARCLAYLLADFLFLKSSCGRLSRIPFKEAFAELKFFLQPITPPNYQLERALSWLIRRRKRYYGSRKKIPKISSGT